MRQTSSKGRLSVAARVGAAGIGVVALLGAALGAIGLGGGATTVPGSSTDKTFAAGSLIVDMGQLTGVATEQTLAQGLKPYGFIFELLVDRKIPVSWIIANGKVAGNPPATGKTDADDFTASVLLDGSGGAVDKTYKGSAFVVDQRYLSDLPGSIVTTWRGQGVHIDVAAADFVAPEFTELRSWPKAVLDAQNGSLAIPYYQNAGIPETLTPTVPAGSPEFASYSFKSPDELNPCDDIYVMPHADPTWETHQNLKAFNDAGGAIWAGCHAISVLESLDGPDADTDPDLNFLSTTGLLLYGDHSDGTIPYAYSANGSDPIMQFLGTMDAATQNGSEQIIMPKADGAWRPTTKVLVWDPTQADVPGSSPGEAATLAYGRGFGNDSNGIVMYEAGHTLNKGTVGDAAAQRAFLNEHLLAGYERAPEVLVDAPDSAGSGSHATVSATVTGGSAPYAYQWQSSCGGTFETESGVQNEEGTFSTTFTPPPTANPADCNVRVLVIDDCERTTFGIDSTVVTPPDPPVAEDDAFTTAANTPLNDTVTTNDTYADGATFAVTTPPSVSDGTVDMNADGSFTFTPASDFSGVTTFDYQVCLAEPLDSMCDPATGRIAVGPGAVDDSYGGDFNADVTGDVSDNDSAPAGSTFSLTNPPPTSDGAVDFNPDGSFTFTPADGFSGVTTFDYQVCLPDPDSDVCATATATIGVGPHAVDDSYSGAFQTDVTGDVSGNDTAPSGSSFTVTAPPGSDGDVNLNTDGTFTFTPAFDFTGVTTFDYQVCLASPFEDLCDTATARIAIGPDATDDAYAGDFNTDVTGDVSGNDTAPSGSTFSVNTPPPTSDGTVDMNADGTFTFSPAADFSGVTTFHYRVCLADPDSDVCDTAIVTITIGPGANDDDYGVEPGTGPLDGDLSPNDTYPQNATFSLVTDPEHGSVTLDPAGTFIYTPDPAFIGDDQFTYEVCIPVESAGEGLPSELCSTAVASLQVQAIADLAITKHHDSTLVPGQTVRYTIDAVNNGPSDVFGVNISDEMPSTLSDATWDCAADGGALCPAASGTGAPSLTLDMPNGSSVHIQVTATLAANASGDVANTARIEGPPGLDDPNPDNNVAVDSENVVQPATGALAFTGSSVGMWVLVGLVLVLSGFVFVKTARRRRRA